ncbi:translation initiation factor IF-3, putative [Plasmodium vinckei brucechwatti]|uniref:Translation initiation factor IF-3, putative n=1 Tax=Plasmodium vinckei brucechwatti TaxID=119398 RepID=A0A6V7RZG2_PLAVN|nr:translation initiation factor IF-3, putative [Plasmodium vinckei brucechwatti]
MPFIEKGNFLKLIFYYNINPKYILLPFLKKDKIYTLIREYNTNNGELKKKINDYSFVKKNCYGERKTERKNTNAEEKEHISKSNKYGEITTNKVTIEDIPSSISSNTFIDKEGKSPYLGTSLNIGNYKKKIPYYNIDPSVKTKKIQIYHNCETHDMDRKINQIKNYLLNSTPVDILLICNADISTKENIDKQNGDHDNNNSSFKDGNKTQSNSEICYKYTNFTEFQKINKTKYSLQTYAKIHLLLNHLRNIAYVDEIFRHIKNQNHIILIKAYPK